MTNDLKIADLVEDPDAGEWLDYPEIPGFRLLFAVPDNPAQIRLATLAARLKPVVVPEGGQADPAAVAAQDAEYHYLKVRQHLAGWEGLKIKDLGHLFPGKKLNLGEGSQAGTPAPPETELAYNPANLDFLLRKSTAFYRFLNAQVNAREVREEADRKNSRNTPPTSPIPMPRPARVAGKKRSSTA
ncbi:MAG: hypothetical protein NTY36_01240 [Deltaproteobacteria bacterium]|nr:hypothetical protein [Deltaproteobacteria bacterium]